MDSLAVPGLVLCFCAFLAIVVWTCTRPRKEIDAQSRLPLDEDD
jgi:cbb3-type cytochrome oxidase subunit 3